MKKLIVKILVIYLIILIAGYLFFAFCAWDIEIYKIILKWDAAGRGIFLVVLFGILYSIAETEIDEHNKIQ